MKLINQCISIDSLADRKSNPQYETHTALPTMLHPDIFLHFLTFRNTTMIQTYPWNDNDEVFSLNYSKHAQKSRNIPAKTDPETAHTGFPQFHIYN